MDDSLLCDIYEDLSVDKWAKSGLADRDSSIDLFTEALAVNTIDKVEGELSELRKENEKLRRENAELKEIKQQLSKNISSLFLTARREIMDKEQKIAKLMLERQQENREQCRPITDESVETLRKSQKLDSIHREDKHFSPVRGRSNAYVRENPVASRDRLNISQLHSRSSSQDVGSRKRHRSDKYDDQLTHKRKSTSSHSESQKTAHDKLKSHSVSGSASRDVNESNNHRTYTSKHRYSTSSNDRQPHESTVHRATSRKEHNSIAQTNNMTKISKYEFKISSDDRQPHESTVHRTTSRLEHKSITQTNMAKISGTDIKNDVKLGKMDTSQTGVVINAQKDESAAGSGRHTEVVSCSKLDALNCKSNTVSVLPESTARSSSQFNLVTLPFTASKSTTLKYVLGAEKDVDKTSKSLNHNSNNSSAAFNYTETYESHSAQSVKNRLEGTTMNVQIQALNLPHDNQPRAYIKSTKCSGGIVTAQSVCKDNVSGDVCANSKIKGQETDMSHLDLGCISLPYKSPYKRKDEIVSDIKDVFHLSERSLDVTKGHKQALVVGKDAQKQSRHKSSREYKNLCGKPSTSNECDKNNSGSSFCQEKPCINDQLGYRRVDDCEASSMDNNVTDMQHVTYMTCTSNLILLGDEETTCTTLASPNKFQPSEFYPPGVRGDVREGGSHVRHIRGLTEVITKLPTDMNYSFHNGQDNAFNAYSTVVDETCEVKTTRLDDAPDETFLSGNNISLKETSLHSPNMCQSEAHQILSTEQSHARPDSSNKLSNCTTKAYNWVSTVHEMFGHVFKKNLHAWKHESEYPAKSEVGDMNSSRNVQLKIV